MIIQEDNAATYSMALSKKIDKDYITFNKERARRFLDVKDSNGKKIEDKFPYLLSGVFTAEVLDYFEKHYKNYFLKYKKDIIKAANDYFKQKKAVEKEIIKKTNSRFDY